MQKAAIALLFAALLSAQSDHKPTRSAIDDRMTELSNWARWGKDDLGKLNLITSAKRREAAPLVKERHSISMSHKVLTEREADNQNPLLHTMLPRTGLFQMDNYNIPFHGMGQTEDALCHASYEGK